MVHRTILTEQEWTQREKDYRAWWEGELKRPLVVLECLKDASAGVFSSVYRDLHCFGLDMPAEQAAEQIEQSFSSLEYLGDAFPRWWPNFGPGILSSYLGCPHDYADGGTWFHEIPNADLASYDIADPENSPWELRIAEITRAAAQRLGDTVVFGFPDIGGPLDILASMFGSAEVLMTMLEHPEAVVNQHNKVCSAWKNFYLRFKDLLDSIECIRPWRGSWMPVMAPGDTYPLQCDLSIMISQEMFSELVMDDMRQSCRTVSYPFYHLDGPGSVRHLDMLLEIDELRGIQWVPGAGAAPAHEWTDVLQRIREAGKLCQVYVSPEGARAICETLGGEGFLLCIGDGALLNLHEGEACMRMLEEFL